MSQQRQQERPNADQQGSINYGDIFLEVQENLTNPISQDIVNTMTYPSGEETIIKNQKEAKPQVAKEKTPITIGQALQATVLTAGQKAIDRSDAAAIQAAEVRATGRSNVMPGGLAATAQSAAEINARAAKDEEKITIAHVLSDAGSKLPKDRPVTRQDAEGVVGAELRNNPNISTYPGGVAASVLAAARLNQCYTQTIG